MIFPKKEIVEAIRKEYPGGTRVRLVSMIDPYSRISPGEIGTVDIVDDVGTIHVAWDCGEHLGIAYGEDKCEKV